MAEHSRSTPTHRPKSDATLEPRAYVLSAHFHPGINLSKGGYKFASDISDYLEARTITVGPDQWQFTQPLGSVAGGQMQLTIGANVIHFEIGYPTHRMDWLADRCKMVLQVFTETFKPKIMLLSNAKVAGTMQIDGDAREFLVRHVTSFNADRFTMLKRPIHLFGIRIFCPPYKKDVKKGRKTVPQLTNWQIEIKAESLVEDASKLYLEADAQWPAPGQWDEPNINEMVGHLKLVNDYLAKDVMEFLQKPNTTGETP